MVQRCFWSSIAPLNVVRYTETGARCRQHSLYERCVMYLSTSAVRIIRPVFLHCRNRRMLLCISHVLMFILFTSAGLL